MTVIPAQAGISLRHHQGDSRFRGNDRIDIKNGMTAFVYILTNKIHSVLYIGVTTDLPRRIIEHKSGEIKGFSQKYKTDKLIYAEQFLDIETAIQREKAMKKWNRQWKDALIARSNPQWNEILPY